MFQTNIYTGFSQDDRMIKCYGV